MNEINNSFYNDLGDRWYTAEDDPVALLRAEGKLKARWIRDRIAGLGVTAPLKFLDVGCGAGILTNRLSSEPGSLPNLKEIIGLDLSESSLAVARAHDPGCKVRYVQGDAQALPFADGEFDVVSNMDFLEHVEDPQAIVKECARVLKPGGIFFFHTFNRNPLAGIIVIKGVEWFVKNTPAHMHVYRLFVKPSELQSYCDRAGLRVEEWTGLRPKVLQRAFWRMLVTGRVSSDFEFLTTASLKISYMGLARKAKS